MTTTPPRPTRAQLDARLDFLEGDVERILRELPPEFQAEALACEGESIREDACGEDQDYVYQRVEAMLIRAGLINAPSHG